MSEINYRNSKGELHKEDGPALITAIGSKAWFLNGKLHRLDGPAVEWASGNNTWWIDGISYTEEEFNSYIRKLIPQETRQLTL